MAVSANIVSAGSYYLNEPLTGSNGFSGIKIMADHVTIDLMGYQLVV
jgi:hypothetical protein